MRTPIEARTERSASDIVGSDFVRSLPAPRIDASGCPKNMVTMGLERRQQAGLINWCARLQAVQGIVSHEERDF